jgi:hypothetical protein
MRAVRTVNTTKYHLTQSGPSFLAKEMGLLIRLSSVHQVVLAVVVLAVVGAVVVVSFSSSQLRTVLAAEIMTAAATPRRTFFIAMRATGFIIMVVLKMKEKKEQREARLKTTGEEEEATKEAREAPRYAMTPLQGLMRPFSTRLSFANDDRRVDSWSIAKSNRHGPFRCGGRGCTDWCEPSVCFFWFELAYRQASAGPPDRPQSTPPFRMNQRLILSSSS